MPIFEYQCQACGHQFDALQKVGEGVLRKCPECGKLKLRKLLSAPSFHLKGSGWYKTDFRDKGGKDKGGKNKGGDDAPAADAKSGEGAAKPGHTLDSGKAHSHDDHGHGHSHGPGGHTHGPGTHKH